MFQSSEPAARECLSELRLSLTTATAATSLIASFIIGFFANLPMGLASGMGAYIQCDWRVVLHILLHSDAHFARCLLQE